MTERAFHTNTRNNTTVRPCCLPQSHRMLKASVVLALSLFNCMAVYGVDLSSPEQAVTSYINTAATGNSTGHVATLSSSMKSFVETAIFPSGSTNQLQDVGIEASNPYDRVSLSSPYYTGSVAVVVGSVEYNQAWLSAFVSEQPEPAGSEYEVEAIPHMGGMQYADIFETNNVGVVTFFLVNEESLWKFHLGFASVELMTDEWIADIAERIDSLSEVEE